jgi:hypothetical protein
MSVIKPILVIGVIVAIYMALSYIKSQPFIETFGLAFAAFALYLLFRFIVYARSETNG